MTAAPSDHLKAAIRKVLDDTEMSGAFLDAYKAAAEVQIMLPDEHVDLEDIVTAMLAGRGGLQVVEFDPPALIIDITVAVPDEDDEAPELLASTRVA